MNRAVSASSRVPRVIPAIFAVALLTAPVPGSAVIIRHDRDDARYVELAEGYPQVVDMNTQEPGGPPDGQGALVAPRWVATAAHIAVLVQPGHRVTVGGDGVAVRSIHLHPEWDDGPHDIALVELARPVDGVEPVGLYGWRDEESREIVVVGRGDTGTGETGPTGNDRKVRAATNVIDEASDLWLKFEFDRGEAATDLEGISGPGDSGGPAFLRRDGETYLAGVSSAQSTRATGGNEGLYGVTEYYTRLSSYLDWLRGVMTSDGGF